CLPNKFAAAIPASEADTLIPACIQSCRKEWNDIGKTVHSRLDKPFRALDPNWDRNWQKQLDSFFAIHCVVLPLAEGDDRGLDQLGIRQGSDRFARQWDVLAALLDATRSVRHMPPYRPERDEQRHVALKCSLMGSFEQMGPADLDASGRFWKELATPTWR